MEKETMYRSAIRYLAEYMILAMDEKVTLAGIKKTFTDKFNSLSLDDLITFKEALVIIRNVKDEALLPSKIREYILKLLKEYNTVDTELYLCDMPEPDDFKDLIVVLNNIYINLIVTYTESQHRMLVDEISKYENINISYLSYVRLNIIKAVYTLIMSYENVLITEDRFTISHLRVPMFKTKEEIANYLIISIIYYGDKKWKN